MVWLRLPEGVTMIGYAVIVVVGAMLAFGLGILGLSCLVAIYGDDDINWDLETP